MLDNLTFTLYNNCNTNSKSSPGFHGFNRSKIRDNFERNFSIGAWILLISKFQVQKKTERMIFTSEKIQAAAVKFFFREHDEFISYWNWFKCKISLISSLIVLSLLIYLINHVYFFFSRDLDLSLFKCLRQLRKKTTTIASIESARVQKHLKSYGLLLFFILCT